MTQTLTVRAKPEDLSRVEAIVAEVSYGGNQGDGGHFGKAFKMASAIRALHQAITDDMMQDIMGLQGTGLGFLTDKDKAGGYDLKTVKLVAIEAALMGAHWVGNEFNIIAERPYLTKNYYTRALREFPGFTDLKLFPGVPVLAGDKGALVPYVATWKLNGVEDSIERVLTNQGGHEIDERICVRVNAGMGADAILGKAERKIKAAIYARLTGSEVTDGDVDEVLPPSHDRPQTTEEVNEDLLSLARMDFAAEQEATGVDFCRDKLLEKAENDCTRAAIKGLAEERKAALGKTKKQQKELVQ